MVTKPASARKCINVSDIIKIVCLLHVSASLKAILRQVRYKGWM
jgi:hypothetical protein